MKLLTAVLLTVLSTTSGFTSQPTKITSRSLHQSSPLYSERTPEEEEFFTKTKQLCNERNLNLTKVKNARDLASVRNSPIQPNRIFRTGRVSDASEQDLELLKDQLEIKTLVDLRSPTELKDDPTLDREAVFGEYVNLVFVERKNGVVKELNAGESRIKEKKRIGSRIKNLIHKAEENGEDTEEEEEDFLPTKLLRNAADVAAVTAEYEEEDGNLIVAGSPELFDEDDEEDEDVSQGKKKRFVKVYPPGTIFEDESRKDRKERHFVSIMNELKYVKGTVSKVRKRDIAKVIIESPGALVSKRVRSHIKKPFLDEINGGGLPMLNELLLTFGAPGIHYVLNLCKDRNRHPIAFYCTAGKDRTGMIAAIILAALGVQEEDIVEDYSLSANVYAEMDDHKAMVGALSQRSLDAKTFLGAPPQVMKDTLKNINEKWGSVEGYLDWIGFDEEDRDQLKHALMDL
ncbi:hypothetical protein CTEN210_17952 [Chaetoceros tenuissimus]|uniref:Tyrosine specific protein phosphatases domain-containing protein n=1 Tax=Chaetoceros tenuissimus TaxID=426638 RepID=A0AAD3DDU4_9STRA|nr:hypothetical protein CTEN210_17952 [Chaetoceros tenuissimus]